MSKDDTTAKAGRDLPRANPYAPYGCELGPPPFFPQKGLSGGHRDFSSPMKSLSDLKGSRDDIEISELLRKEKHQLYTYTIHNLSLLKRISSREGFSRLSRG